MKILPAIDDSKFSEAAAKSLAGQFRPQGTEVRVLQVVEPIAISEPPEIVSRILSGAGGATAGAAPAPHG